MPHSYRVRDRLQTGADPTGAAPAHDRRGVALVLVAGGLVCLMGLVGLVVDLGYLYVVRAHSQTVADVACLSSLRLLDPALPPADQASDVENRARRILRRNGYDPDAYRIRTDRIDGGGLEISIEGGERTEAWFTRVFGHQSFVVGVGSRARAGAAGAGGVVARLVP